MPDRIQTTLWLGFALATLFLLYLLGPMLVPFALAAILAYIGDPLVERLSHYRLARPVSALLVILTMLLVVFVLVLSLIPLLREEGLQLFSRLPDLINLTNEKLAPWLQAHFGITFKLQLSRTEVQQFLIDHWGNLQTVLTHVFHSALNGGAVVIQLLSTLLITPVAVFYLLRDWPVLLQRIENLIPRAWHRKTVDLIKDIDNILAEFLRGQILVMVVLAAYYSLALAIFGINFALLLGLLTGILIFIPYLGFTLGFALSLAVATLQFAGWQPIMAVLLIYGVGQLLESFILTPFLVGERIGLHPLAVIFALMAFGQLFGFFGILLALPASAALLVSLRRLRALYLDSRFYTET